MRTRLIFLLLGLVGLAALAGAQPQAEDTSHDLSYFLPKGDYTYDPAVPTPEQSLGFPLGRQHADWGQVVAYMKALAASSDRVSVRETMRTYQYRPFIEVTITAPGNQRKLDRLREEHLALTDADRSASLDLERMPVVVSLVYSIHGNEPSGVNSSLAVAYFLAAARGGDIEALLENSVILLTPGANPDGINRFASWVNSSRSQTDVSDLNSREFLEPWPSSRTNHYWADCNRDWLMLQHPEGRNGVDNYMNWLPNVLADLHEQGSARPYYFSPGHPKRVHQLVTAENQALASAVSAVCAEELDKIGTLYYSKEGYDDYYMGKGAAYGDICGSICLLYEQGTSRGHLRETKNGIRSFAWTIRNQAYGSYGTILAAYRQRKALLDYQRAFFQDIRRDAPKQAVQGYVFDSRGSRAVAYHFLENMAHHRVEVYHLAKDMTAGGESFKAGEAYVIPVNQKFNPMVRTLMENCLEYTDSIFYDISTWTFPHAFNLRYAELQSVGGLLGERARAEFIPGKVIGGKSEYGYLFTNTEFYAPKLIYELARQGVHLYAGNRPFHFHTGDLRREMGYGTILVPAQNQPLSADELYRQLSDLAKEAGVDVYAAETGLMEDVDLGSPAFQPLREPKVAILVGRSMGIPESGEAWFLLDRRFQMRPTLIETANTPLTPTKLQRYNTIILANGVPHLTAASERALKEWVAAGGTLIAEGKAYSWVSDAGLLPIRVKDASFKEDSAAYRPFAEKKEADAGNDIDGVILSCHLDRSHPLAWGLDQPEIALMKRSNIIFEKDADPYVSPLYYTAEPLLSGFLSAKNEALLRNTPAVLAKPYKSGAVIVFTDDMNFRSYYFGTAKIFMNAILFGDCL